MVGGLICEGLTIIYINLNVWWKFFRNVFFDNRNLLTPYSIAYSTHRSERERERVGLGIFKPMAKYWIYCLYIFKFY